MFERFTHAARHSVVLAQEEARTLNHDHIDTGHLLLGLVHEDTSRAAVALESSGISLGDLRHQVHGKVGQGRAPSPEVMQFTSTAQAVFEASAQEATQLAHEYIGTEHILVSLMEVSDPDDTARGVLEGMGVEPSRIRAQITDGPESGRRSFLKRLRWF